MTQTYEIEVAENGYLVKFTGSSTAARPETYVFPTFVGLAAFMSQRVKWIEKKLAPAPARAEFQPQNRIIHTEP